MKSIELESLLQTTEFISKELATIKDDIENHKTHSDYPETSAVSYIDRAIRLRQSFRSMADGIQGKRSLVQLQKEKIQKSKNFIQGLQYYKTTLINKIKQSHLEATDLQEFEESPLKVNDWIQDYPQIDTHLHSEIKKKEEQKEELKRLLQQKTEKQQQGKYKKDLYEKILPEKAQKIYQEVLQTAKLCEIKELESFANIANPKLSVANEKLSALRINSTISVNYLKDVHEELEIVLLKNNFQLFKLANLNKVPLEQHEVKFTITSLKAPLNELVIGIDRREDFSNQQVFQRLFNDELIKPVFLDPQNQSERNINAKYIKVNWLEDSFLTGVISPLQFVNKIKERVFSLMLVAFMSQNMKKLGFFFPLTSEQEIQGPINLQAVFKKTMTGSLQKINFQEYLSEMHIPSWVEKYRLKYAQLEAQRQNLDYENQQKYKIDKSNYLTVLKLLKLEELEEPNLNNYYKGTLQIHQGKLQFLLIMPFAYPRKLSKIVITNWHKKREEEKKLAGLEHIPCIAKLKTPKKIFSKKIMSFEKEINESIHHFYRDPGNQPFRVLLQVNRLISLVGLHAQKKL